MSESIRREAGRTRTLVSGGERGSWTSTTHDTESTPYLGSAGLWAAALGGDYKQAMLLRDRDFSEYDLILIELDFSMLAHIKAVLREREEGSAQIVGMFSGSLDRLHPNRAEWAEVADMCDAVVCPTPFGRGYLASVTTAPVYMVEPPYPVEEMRRLRMPTEERDDTITLCGMLLDRSTDYEAAKGLGHPMIGFERSFKRSFQQTLLQPKEEQRRWVSRAEELFGDSNLSVVLQIGLKDIFRRAGRSTVWMNLDPRYIWERTVLDAAALEVPVITTANTGHGPLLFPELVVESPYDIDGASGLARRLIDDPEWCADVVRFAREKLDAYRPERAVEELMRLLGTTETSAA